MRKFVKLENKSAVPIHGVQPGATVQVETDQEGTPLDRRWRRRLADDDGAIEIVSKTKKKKEG